MARYIDADAITLKVKRYLIPNTDNFGMVGVEDAERYFLKLLENTPTADVVEVKHAKWIGKNGRDYYTCSNCCVVAKSKDDAYCRGCGARMDGTPKERGEEK